MSEDLLKRLTEATSEELDALLAEVERRRRGPARPSRPAGESSGDRPVSFAQERMWFLEHLEPGGAAYHVWLVARVSGPLKCECLRESLRVVMDRQEQLGASFHSRDGTLVQAIAPRPALPLAIVDLSGVPQDGRERLVQSVVDSGIGRVFDLSLAPLFRVILIREGLANHRLVLVLHHAVADAWSVRVLLREMGIAYRALASGQEPCFAPMELQYADFASWQRQWLAGGVAERQLSFWKDSLRGIPSHLEFPTDFPRSPDRPPQGGRTAFQLPASADALRQLARGCRTTVFAVLLTAYQVLLSRLTGQSCVVVGSPVAGRNWTEVEGVVGLFVNTLPLRGDVGGDPRLVELLDRTTRTIAGALANQDVPFEYLVQELRPVRDRTRTPIFQTMLQFTEEEPVAVDLPGIRCEGADAAPVGAKFDFSLSVTASPTGRLDAAIDYDARLFGADTMACLAEAYASLLGGILSSPERCISAFPLTTPRARDVLLEQGRGPRRTRPAECLDRLVEIQAHERPDAVAATDGGRTIGYRELDERANRLGHRLIASGLRPGDAVAVRLPRSLDLLVAILGIFKAGAAFLPLNPQDPPDRARWILADAGASLVVTREAALGSTGLECVSPDDSALEQYPPTRPLRERTPDGIAYIIYTSGSTGAPKGVCVSHANVAELIEWSQRLLAITGRDRVLQQFAPSFDLSIFEIFVTLIGGGALVIPPDETLLSPRRLVDFIEAHGVTVLQGTPTHVQAILSADRPLGGVRAVCLGGETFSRSLLARLEERIPAGCRVFNMYGPTETGILCTLHEVDRGNPAPYRSRPSLPIGGPTAGANLYVVDGHGGLLPLGAVGELWVGGSGVAIGYRTQPALTAERFVPDPFERGSRAYRTGDRVRWLPGGVLEFLGRIDQQVKIRGFRVEPGEVEAVLSQHPGVTDAAVIAREEAGEVRLVAYVAARSTDGATALELRRFVAAALPQYMIPSELVVLDRLPRTASGKVDRLALPLPAAGSDAHAGHAPPRTETERRVLEIWQQTLGRAGIGIHDNFFELGGHSLQAARLTARIGDSFECDVPLRCVFDSPTVAGLAAVVDERASSRDAASGAAASRRPPIAVVPRGDDLVLAPQQEDWWIQEQLTGGIHPNNIQCGLRFTGPLDAMALEQSVAALQRRHEGLRTAFHARDGGAVPVIAEPGTLQFRLESIDLAGLPPSERDEAVARAAAADQSRPFDLGQGACCRVTLVRLGPDDHVVLFTTHHLVCDAWSINVLMSEITQVYAGCLEEEPAQLPPLPFQYVDFARWQRDQLAGPEFEAHLAYWMRQLAPPWPDLFAPAQGVRGTFDSPHFAVRRRTPLVIRQETLEAAREVARTARCTLFCAVMATLKLALFARTRQPDVRVATLGANRSIAGCEGVVGLFTNVLCIRTHLAGTWTIGELIDAVHGAIRDGSSHQELPFGSVARALEAAASGERRSLFQAAVFWQPLVHEPQQFPRLRTTLFRPLTRDSLVLVRSTSLELTLDLVETPADLGGAITYNPNCFSEEDIRRLVDDWQGCVSLALAQPAATVSDLCGSLRSGGS